MIPTIGRREVEQFRNLVADRFGLSFDDSKFGLLAETLRRRLDAGNGAGENYLRALAAPNAPLDELRQLARDLTVTETYFYRGIDQIRAFAERILPQRLAARAEAAPVRVLSAGCASGEEPYSLAMAVREWRPQAADKVAIAAVDVNPAMLEKARRAHYSAWSLRDLPAELHTRWFRVEGSGFNLDNALRRAVAFEEGNLVHDDPELWRAGSWDVIFCRNVLMYFDPAIAQAIVARMARALAPGGYLFLGHAETLRGLSSDFHLCHTHDTFYYQLKEASAEREDVPPPAPRIAWSTLPRLDDATWVETVRRASARIDALAVASQSLAALPAAAEPVSDPSLHRALELVGSERFEEALGQLSALSSEQARAPEVLLLRAVSLAHSGALKLAQEVSQELIRHDELNAGAHYVLALCREGLGDLAGALDEDQVALYLDPGFAMARLHLGILARRRGERDTARRELGQALSLLQQEDSSRLLLFGGGFRREALVALCRAELAKCGERT